MGVVMGVVVTAKCDRRSDHWIMPDSRQQLPLPACVAVVTHTQQNEVHKHSSDSSWTPTNRAPVAPRRAFQRGRLPLTGQAGPGAQRCTLQQTEAAVGSPRQPGRCKTPKANCGVFLYEWKWMLCMGMCMCVMGVIMGVTITHKITPSIAPKSGPKRYPTAGH